MTDEELRLTDRYKVELENAIYYYRPRTDRETELIELLILEKIRVIEELKQDNKEERENAVIRLFQNQKLQKENAELKEELRQKSDTNHSLVEQLADKEIIISELKEQIEKMKCCGNCYHRFESNSFHCGECKRFNYGINTDKWELIV